MRPFPRRIVASSQSILSEGPLSHRALIGRNYPNESTTSRWLSSCGKQKHLSKRTTTVKRTWSGSVQPGIARKRIGGFRWSSTSSGERATSVKRSNTAPLLGLLFGATAVTYLGAALVSNDSGVEVSENTIESDDGESITGTEDVRKIRLAEVPKHNRHASGKWVIRETSVYDISEFIEQHPGGEVILRACGGSIDPYWKIFSIHNTNEVYDILREYHIGEVDERDLDDTGHIDWNVLGAEAANQVVDDPFKHDPERDQDLIVRTAKPCNAETPGKLLKDFLTPLRLFFVRNHLWVPQEHETPQSLTIELSDGEEKTYTLADLKQKFKEHTITATLQCAGNRRSHMSQAAEGLTSGLQWDVGAIGTAEFTGVRLRDVLRDSGYSVENDCPTPKQHDDDDCDCDKHIHFASPGDTYAASIPLQTAINPQADVLLAWNMNGEPLNRDHGGPLRAIVPGTTAARSVKWLGRISIDYEEAQSQWQRRDYKCFGPNLKQKDCTNDDWDEAQSIQETPVQSAITNIIKADGGDSTTVQGFAFSGGGRGIERVDVSVDGGQTWKQASLHRDKAKGSRRWAWTLWNIDWPKSEMGAGQEFVVKATDDAYNTQPETFDSTWNFRGLLGNAWHRMSASTAA